MGQLHELLAVEGELEGQFKKILAETLSTFAKKPDHFLGSVLRAVMFAEEDANLVPADEHSKLDTTVNKKLAYMFKTVQKYLNAVAQKDLTNQSAKADVVVDGKTILSDVPVTTLLGLETKLKQVRDVLTAIPTMPPGVEFELDPSQGEDVYKRVHPEEKFLTRKTFRHQILVQATEHHPAQIEKWEEDQRVGKKIKEVWSGMLTPAQKSDMLGRCDSLIRAVKQARQRANSEEVKNIKIGNAITDFIMG